MYNYTLFKILMVSHLHIIMQPIRTLSNLTGCHDVITITMGTAVFN